VLRRRIRTGALIAIIGLIRLARVVRARPGLAFLLAGALLSVAGNMLSSGIAFIAGMLVFLRGRGRPARRDGTAPPGRSAGGPGRLLRVRDPAAGPGESRQGYQLLARCSVSSARNWSGWSRCGPWPASSMTASR